MVPRPRALTRPHARKSLCRVVRPSRPPANPTAISTHPVTAAATGLCHRTLRQEPRPQVCGGLGKMLALCELRGVRESPRTRSTRPPTSPWMACRKRRRAFAAAPGSNTRSGGPPPLFFSWRAAPALLPSTFGASRGVRSVYYKKKKFLFFLSTEVQPIDAAESRFSQLLYHWGLTVVQKLTESRFGISKFGIPIEIRKRINKRESHVCGEDRLYMLSELERTLRECRP